MREQGWIALLRAVNLGKRNKVPMGELRSALAELGCSDVRTYIQSGNVVLASADGRGELARKLEHAIADRFGVSSTVVLRSFEELRAVAAAHPFGTDTSHTMVAFLATLPAPAKLRSLQALEVAPDRFEVTGSDVYLHLPNGMQGARLSGAVLERQLGVQGTVRNWRTVARLVEMTEETT